MPKYGHTAASHSTVTSAKVSRIIKAKHCKHAHYNEAGTAVHVLFISQELHWLWNNSFFGVISTLTIITVYNSHFSLTAEEGLHGRNVLLIIIHATWICSSILIWRTLVIVSSNTEHSHTKVQYCICNNCSCTVSQQRRSPLSGKPTVTGEGWYICIRSKDVTLWIK